METAIPLVMGLIEEAIKIEPAVATEIASLFSKGIPTPADWQAYRAKNAADSFETLAPDAAANLPAPAPAVPAAIVVPPLPGDTLAPVVTKPPADSTETAQEAAPAPALALHPIFGTPITPQ